MINMREKGLFVLLVLLFCILSVVVPTSGITSSKGTKLGDLFPSYAFPPPTSSQDLTYLGLTEQKPFSLGDVQAELIVLELLNIYCTSCQKQAPIYNEIYALVEKDPIMKGKVKWMGVGIGNNENEVEFFRKSKDIPFPILTDTKFKLYEAIGGPGGIRTPLTILVRKDNKGRGIVVDSHMGFRRDKDEIVEGIKAALQYDIAYLEVQEGKRVTLPVTEKLKPPISDEELLAKIKAEMVAAGGVVEEIRRIPPEDEYLFVGKLKINGGERKLFAKVVSWPPVCDICHDIHFVYLFDQEGKITGFIPLHLTKFGNRVWDEKDIQAMKNRLIGRSILQPFEFNRDVDAVSRATITSIVIFQRLDKGKEIYTALMKQGYLK
jgi:thiol-disulfide isomerase/thioredoxin